MQGAEPNGDFKITMEVMDKWLEQSPKQMAIAIGELILAFREVRDPVWTNINDNEILEIATFSITPQ